MPLLEHNPRGLSCVAVSISLNILALVILLARLYTRIYITKTPGVDDALVTVAWVFSVALLVTIAIQAEYGMGLHYQQISTSDIVNFQKAFWASLWTYNICLTSTKLSILFQYLRIFITPRFQLACKCMVGVITVYGLWTVFGTMFVCWPIPHFWDPSIPGNCMNEWHIYYANAGLSIGTDLLTILLPMPVLKNLRLPLRQRLALMMVFAIGGFVCLISIIRLYLIHKINTTIDWSWENVDAAEWSSIECCIAIICASLPSLKSGITRFFPTIFGARSSADRSRALYGASSRNHKRGEHSRGLKMQGNTLRSSDQHEWIGPKYNNETTVLSNPSDVEAISLEDYNPKQDTRGINVVTTFTQEYEAQRSADDRSLSESQKNLFYEAGPHGGK